MGLKLRSTTTPESVQKLQTALHAKAKESPDYRFYALYDKEYRKDILAHASPQSVMYRLPDTSSARPFTEISALVAPSLHRNYPASSVPFGPLRHPKRPGLSLARRQLTHASITVRASRVASVLLCMHAVVITPAGSAEAVRSYPSIDIGLPHVFAGSAPASNGFVVCSTFTRVTTCMLTESPSDPLHQRLQQLRYLHYRFDCYRMERTRFRAGLIPLKNSAFHGARKPPFYGHFRASTPNLNYHAPTTN